MKLRIRYAWETVCKREFLIEVQVSVFRRVFMTFSKSKQIIRELNLIETKTGKYGVADRSQKPTKEDLNTSDDQNKTPDTIKELQKKTENAQIVTQCLMEAL